MVGLEGGYWVLMGWGVCVTYVSGGTWFLDT